MTSNDRVSRAGDLVFAEIDGEAVALNAERGICYGVNGVGLQILKLIEQPVRVGDLCERLVADYDVEADTCQEQVMGFLAEMEAEGLVHLEQPGSGA